MSTLINWLDAGRRLAERIPYSIVALVARVAAASVFWRSGQTKVDGLLDVKDSTFFLFREEYRVPLLPPDLAAYLTTYAEHAFSVFLLVGFASRLSALGLIVMTAVNLLSARAYGEFEFWFSSIKVSAIIAFILVAAAHAFGLTSPAGEGFANLTAHGGFAPKGAIAADAA